VAFDPLKEDFLIKAIINKLFTITRIALTPIFYYQASSDNSNHQPDSFLWFSLVLLRLPKRSHNKYLKLQARLAWWPERYGQFGFGLMLRWPDNRLLQQSMSRIMALISACSIVCIRALAFTCQYSRQPKYKPRLLFYVHSKFFLNFLM